jgi:hypothetical protein
VAKRYTRKQLKRPDEFVSFSMKVWSFVQSRAPAVLVTLGVAAVIVAGVWVWSYYSDRTATKSTDLYTRAADIYNQTVVPTADKTPREEDDIPRFSSRAAKLKAADEELGAMVARGGSLRQEAQAMRAAVRYDAGRYRDALADYEKVLSQVSGPVLRVRVLEDMGYCHEGLQEWDKALGFFRQIPREGEGRFLGPYHEARILAKKKQVKEAVRIFQEIVAQAGSSPVQERASDQLALLEDK